MRLTLAILCLLGLAAICLLGSILGGFIRLPSINSPASRPIAIADEPVGTTQPAETQPAMAGESAPLADPPAIADRTIYLYAVAARLEGKATLMAHGTRIVRDGMGRGEGDAALADIAHKSASNLPPFLTKFATASDLAEWTFKSPAPGQYSVALVYGCPLAHNASRGLGTFDIRIGNDLIAFTPKPMVARAATYLQQEIGTVSLPAGEVHLTFRPRQSDSRMMMIRIRSVKLIRSS